MAFTARPVRERDVLQVLSALHIVAMEVQACPKLVLSQSSLVGPGIVFEAGEPAGAHIGTDIVCLSQTPPVRVAVILVQTCGELLFWHCTAVNRTQRTTYRSMGAKTV